MNMQRYFLKLSYKGTHFFGWQIQPNAISVQETIGNALQKLNHGTPVKITGCGRTDTGVHASEFYAHFDIETILSEEKLIYKLNCMTGTDIGIQRVFKVPNDLHSRFSATKRTYHYFIHTEKNPFLSETSWELKQTIDLDKMNEACQLLMSYKNFKCFSRTITGDSSFECDVTTAKWTQTTEGYKLTISANRFLRNMVRAIVGTTVDVGFGKISSNDFKKIIESKDRNMAGKSAPSAGLFLAKVDYDNDPTYF